MRWPFRNKENEPKSLHRTFYTPEGVDLRLQLAGAGARAAAFILDAVILLLVLIGVTIAVAMFVTAGVKSEFLAIIWLIGFFILRNGWFILFEMGSRGATPGKRVLGIRVVARDGARLTGGAVIARNAMREIEVFLPLSFLAQQGAAGSADAFLILFALAWSGIFLFFPLFNRDRLRVGDLIAGTWVIERVQHRLGDDLGDAVLDRTRHVFSEAALGLYGIYELQTLEDVLRSRNDAAIATVAATIRQKAGMLDGHDDLAFLTDYYVALCKRLERSMILGSRRENKFASTNR